MLRMDSTYPSLPPVDLLWQPDPKSVAMCNFSRYLDWLKEKRGLQFTDYASLWKWSVTNLEAFWESIVEFYEVRFHHPYERVLTSHSIRSAHWFPGATLNYAEHILRNTDQESQPAILFQSEAVDGWIHEEKISREELRRRVAAVSSWLRRAGVQPGDRVAGYLPNIPETVVAFLACASIGAIWSNCPVELSSRSVLDRLVQIAPKVIFSIRQYRYGGKIHDRRNILAEICAGLPGLEYCVLVSGLDGNDRELPSLREEIKATFWEDVLAAPEIPELIFTPVPFEHPLWILYSSGTTGSPKAIVHGHGGILLEHLKALSLHLDLRDNDRFFWYTTSGWMMWNFLVSGLLLPGVTIVLYDGSPKYPDFRVLWELVARHGVTYFGTSAPYLMACRKEGIVPSKHGDLGPLRSLGSTGAPLLPEGFTWAYEQVKQNLLLGSISGGTDVCTAFVLSNPLLPVRMGKIQCLGLGAKIESWTDDRQSVFGQVGELVLTAPFPSMPIFFWNDPERRRFHASYFETYPGVWCHGDWIEIESPGGACVIHGRSDATLNRGGVRMGSAEFYSIVENLPEIAEALVIDNSGLGREDQLLLFVVLRAGYQLDAHLLSRIKQQLRSEGSPRHVPDAIYQVPEIPHTLNGKKLEVPIKRLLAGSPVEKVVNRDTLANPAALQYFVDWVRQFAPALST